jgi:ribose transport system substrate-binding protein
MKCMRLTLATLVCAALAFAVTGCPREQPTEPPKPELPSATGKTGGGTGGKYVIAVLPKGTAQSFWLAVKAGADDACREAGLPEPIWSGPDSETDVPRQIQIVQTMITQKVNAIVMAACDADGLVPYVEQAQKAGIPVIMIDSGLKKDISVAVLSTDNVKGGEEAADALAKVIGDKGKVGCIPFIQGAKSSDDRENGFKQGLKKHPGIQLVKILYSNSDVGEGMTKTQTMLTSTPDLAGIFAANQAGAEGAIQAIKQMGKVGKVRLVCYDASEVEMQALKDGVADALIVQNPYRMGHDGVMTAIKAIKGEKIEPRLIDTGVTVVTKENLNTPEIQKLLNPTAKKP